MVEILRLVGGAAARRIAVHAEKQPLFLEDLPPWQTVRGMQA
jgi:hypothetical protein